MNRYLYLFIPSIMVICLWAAYMVLTERFYLFAENWPISLTMVGGGFMSGATSEGSGAVTFPIFTKVLKISPDVARHFAWIMQSVGMGMASIVILKSGIPFVPLAVVLPAIAGFFGQITATEFFYPYILPAYAKIIFTCLTFSFGVILYLENRDKQLVRVERMPKARLIDYVIFTFGGYIGGIAFGIVGTGLDLIVFAILVTYYNISEKVATPTSVLLQALTCLATVFYRSQTSDRYDEYSRVIEFWLVGVPVSAIMGPVGAIVAGLISRKNVTRILFFLIGLEFLSTLFLVKFDNRALIFAPLTVIALLGFFIGMHHLGMRVRGEKKASAPR